MKRKHVALLLTTVLMTSIVCFLYKARKNAS